MGAGLDSMPGSSLERGKGGCCVSGMEAAGDIRRGDQRHQFLIVRTALAQVAIEIDLHKLDESESP
jgi:hypothetical protein